MSIYIIMGTPGSGKGTLSNILVEKNGFLHISTGKIFREITTEEILSIASHIDNFEQEKKNIEQGLFVSDEVTNLILKKKLSEYLSKGKNIILDGYPRTIEQAEFLSKHFELKKVFYLENEDIDFVVARLCNRYICEANEHVFNIAEFKSNEDKFCKHDGSKLYKRADDTPEVIKKRINVYLEKTFPVVQFYKKHGYLHSINANKDFEDVYEKILKKINE